jgi:hypothetical protein
MGSPPRHEIGFGDVRIEVDFLALDDEDDIKKLRSADYTGAAVHEVQYIDLALFARFGRAQIAFRRNPMVAQPGTVSLPTRMRRRRIIGWR